MDAPAELRASLVELRAHRADIADKLAAAEGDLGHTAATWAESAELVQTAAAQLSRAQDAAERCRQNLNGHKRAIADLGALLTEVERVIARRE